MNDSLSLSITGKVAKVFETVEKNGFEKRKMWLEVEDGNYTQTIEVEFLKDKTSLLNGVAEGSTATVDINLRGKVFPTKTGDEMCFTSLNAWRIKADAPAKSRAASASTKAPAPAPENEDDLPF